MLKMGQMCHCSAEATVAAFVASTGDRLWYAARPLEDGIQEDRLSVCSSEILYVLGTRINVGGATGRVIRRSPSTASAAQDWLSASGNPDATSVRYGGRVLCVSEDGHLWVMNRDSPGGIQKLSSADGTEIGSRTSLDFCLHLFPASGNDAFVFQEKGGLGDQGHVRLLDGDASLTVLASYNESSGALKDALQLGSLIVIANNTTDTRRYRTLDTSLAVVSTYDGSGEATRDPIALGKISNTKFVALESGLRYAAYNDTLTQLWTNSTTIVSHSARDNWLFDSDGTDFYVAQVSSSGTTRVVQKRSGTDGSILWTKTLTLGGRISVSGGFGVPSNRSAITGIAYCGTHLVVVGDLNDGVDDMEIVGLDVSDGSDDWWAEFKPSSFLAPWGVTSDSANDRAFVINRLGTVVGT